ncbi:MAG: multifunctional oxoglutarate decarboxylase/oxoglutarate dehydrogenase thiamine pyrophosphate-binding subunit/dihydrolipoyllysine-residue succinyltransferase subunit, partial [Actinomycetota bacterium]
MQESTSVPTATSVRLVPARLLEVNRTILNRHLGRRLQKKVSFTHLIGWAVVKALAGAPAMNRTFRMIDGRPHVVRHDHVNLGLAVDVKRPDGARTIVVPNIKKADIGDFAAFVAAYEELIRKVNTASVAPDDFSGTTVTITNPGMIGTVQSIPRLMASQAAIVGVGSIDYPAEFAGADPDTLAKIGVGKVLTLTSTYDHRIIQGAESGEFLGHIHRLLLGEDGFYDQVFASMRVAYVPVRWRRDRNPVPDTAEASEKQARVLQLINMYRVRGHLIADLDPLTAKPPHMHPELDPATYGLSIWDLDRKFVTQQLAGHSQLSLGEILAILRDAYCRTFTVEYMHVQEPQEKVWIQQRVEGMGSGITLEDMAHILHKLNEAEAFERFLHQRYVGHKRFSLEGAEALIPMLDAILERATEADLVEVVMGMAHRGRLNVLANTIGKSYAQIFHEFEGNIDPMSAQGSGDVKYHLGATGKHTSRNGRDIIVTLASNPSHLESVDPVVEGMARAKQDLLSEHPRGVQAGDCEAGPAASPVLPILVHGDAAFAGQGVVAETLALSQLGGYRTRGTIHIIVNNQLGFTTGSSYARSSTYASDVAKMVLAPIFHVNGDDPEACVRAARLAFDFRRDFRKDVVIDMWCYRRWGHNEADDPSFTQPLMYAAIAARRSVRELYTETLVKRGDLSPEKAERSLSSFQERLGRALDETRGPSSTARIEWKRPASLNIGPIETGVDRTVLERVLQALTTTPEGFHLHPKLARWLQNRRDSLERDAVDWSLAEALALGSLLVEEIMIRLTGQDTRRGTFSQRHCVLVDQKTAEEYTPLAGLGEGRTRFFVYDSLLSEMAAVGFEYGYSVANPDTLVIWEAQFGDFANGAQVIIDQYLSVAEDKWGQTSGLVLLLPHGYEGQGPEHSSARLERFCQLGGEDNYQVVVPSTPAQYFHLLRRQAHRAVRKPLIVATPKSILRLSAARSTVRELTS